MKKLTVLIMAMLLLLRPAQEMQATECVSQNARTEPLVVVLDPGHDSTHGGATGNGLSESVLNLKIAQYCYEELSTYNNVEVYMTRDSAKCPYPGGSSGNDNSKRVEYAQNVGADVYVSLHLNSLSDTSYGGVEIFYPNANYRPALSTIGEGLSQAVLDELVGLGIQNRGIKVRQAEKTKYSDGSVADYYQVIREAKNRNITGIIVEHAFISCPSDAQNFLSTDAKLKALGVADATGIAKYYGLKKGGFEKVFDVTFYADKYPDLKEKYGYDEAKLLLHFMETGMSEGRQGIESFDPYAYRGRYADLYQVYGSNLSAYYYHYMDTGQAEGRDGTPVDTMYTVAFMFEEEIINSQTVPFGHDATEPDADKDGMFTIYDREFSCITEDTVVQITYEPMPLPEPETESESETQIETESEMETETETESETEVETESEPEFEETESTEPTEEIIPDTEIFHTEDDGPATPILSVQEHSFVWLLLPVLPLFACAAVLMAIRKHFRKKREEKTKEEFEEEIEE